MADEEVLERLAALPDDASRMDKPSITLPASRKPHEPPAMPASGSLYWASRIKLSKHPLRFQ
jgi:hypothetical protein